MKSLSKPGPASARPTDKKAAQAIPPRPTRRWRARIFQGYVVTATLAFLALFVAANLFNYFPIDLNITLGIQRIRAPWFYGLMWLVSFPGYAPQAYLLAGAILLVLFALGLRWEAMAGLLASGGVSLFGTLVKLSVQRPRPTADLVNVFQQLGSYSFPSGHVLFYTAFFGYLLFLAYTLFKPSFGRGLMVVILGSLVALVGVSRISLGQHWASDVLGAYLLGSLWLTLTIYVYRWGKTRFFVSQPLASEKPEAPPSQSKDCAKYLLTK